MILDKIKARGEEMSPLEGHDRLQYLIDIAREVPPLDDKDKIDVFAFDPAKFKWSDNVQ